MRIIEAAALAKVQPVFDRARIRPGVYPVDFTVHVAGVVHVGENYEMPATVDLPLYGVLVTSLLESGVKQAEVLRVIERNAHRALERKQKYNEQLSGQARDLVEGIRRRFSENLPRRECAGAMRAEVKIKKVDSAL